MKWKFSGRRIMKLYLEGLDYPIQIRNHTSDIYVFQSIMLHHEYFVAPEFNVKNIIDCGANIGITSVYFKKLFPSAKIIAVEPEQNNFAVLAQNLGDYKDVSLLQKGIWNKKVNLKISNLSSAEHWSFTVEETTEEFGVIKAIAISDIMDDANIEVIDILKIDIEGSELEVFTENYEYWLPRTRILIVETHDRYRRGCCKAVFNALNKYDFTVNLSGENFICFNNALKELR